MGYLCVSERSMVVPRGGFWPNGGVGVKKASELH